MEKPPAKTKESTNSTTGTTGTPLFFDNIDHNVKYMNLNFIDNSETSSQAKEVPQELKNNNTDATKVAARAPPCKIRPFSVPFGGKMETFPNKNEPILPEKSLHEMGFKCTEIQGWEQIVQPPKESLYKLLKNMIDNHIKPNVQIRIGGVTFNCHMMVLQCYSDFFMECSNEVLIQLPEEKISPGAFMMVYDWMLAEEPLVQREGILELFNAANFLRIKDLVNQCWLCLDDDVRFREDTAFLLYLEARNYGLESLEQLMLTRICKFFLTLVSSKEFLDLNFKEICTLLSSNTIGVNSEIEIFMSAVRWLCKNWAEREAFMLNVIKCVRFSLMPPWFLVTLNKSTDCVEIERVVNHPEVKKMINDGISFTTTQLFYGDNRDEFLHFLERYQLVMPMQRQWVFDKECSYHHRLECPNMQYVTYKSFVEYLEMIQTIGKNYWRNLEMVKGVEKTMQCCVRSDCRKASDKNLASLYEKKNTRDQCIQVETCQRQSYEGVIKESKEAPQVVVKNIPIEFNSNTNNVKNKIRHSTLLYNPEQETNPLKPCCGPQESVKMPQVLQHNSRFSSNKKPFRKATNEQNNAIGQLQMNTKTMSVKTEGNTNIKNICHKKIDKCTILNDNADTQLRNQNRETGSKYSRLAKMSTAQMDFQEIVGKGGPELVDLQRCANVSISSSNLDTYLGAKRKLLIFGGIDPYCQLCPCNQTYSSSKEQELQHCELDCCRYHQEESNLSGGVNGSGAIYSTPNFGDEVLSYDQSTSEWKHLSHIPFGSRHHHSAVVCNGLIYVIGGTRTAFGCKKNLVFEITIWSFSEQCQKWTLETNLPEARRDFAVVTTDDILEKIGTGFYIIGGEGINGEALDSVWFYDILQKAWIKKPSLNMRRYGLTAVVTKNQIWVGGGIVNGHLFPSAEDITDTVEYYNLANTFGDTDCNCGDKRANPILWTVSDIRLRIPRLFGKFCKSNEQEVFLVGGIGTIDNTIVSLSSVDYFENQSGKWVHFGDINNARHGHDVALLDDHIIVIGGVSTMQKRTLISVESFSIKSKTSEIEIAPLPWPLSGCAVVEL